MIIKSLLIIIILLSISFLAVSNISNISKIEGNDSNQDFYLDMPELSTSVQVTEKNGLEIIEEIAWNVSESHEYQRGIYDCTQYSEEAVKQLKELGYNATCVFGIYYNRYFIGNDSYNDASAHNWVNVYIENKTIYLETTQGMNIGIIDDKTYKKDYLPRTIGKCI